jgi:hypothetical protein
MIHWSEERGRGGEGGEERREEDRARERSAQTNVQGLDFGLVVSLNFLRSKVLQAHACSNSGANNVEVRGEGDRLLKTKEDNKTHKKNAYVSPRL